MCDMFGGYCFNTIMSDEVHYKKCQFECLEDCEEIGKYRSFTLYLQCAHTQTYKIVLGPKDSGKQPRKRT